MKTKTITDKWIGEYQPCQSALDWWDKKEKDSLIILKQLIADKKYDWANWMIVRIMYKHEYVAYAIFAAEQVIDIYEKKYTNDNRPRKAIESAKRYLKNPTTKNKKLAAASAAAAAAAVSAAAAAAVAYAAAASSSSAAAAAAYAAADAVVYATDAVVYTTSATKEEMQIKILKYGIRLLK